MGKVVMLHPVRTNKCPSASVIQREATVRLLRYLGSMSTSFEVEVPKESRAARILMTAGYTPRPSHAGWQPGERNLEFSGTTTSEAVALLVGSRPETPDQVWPWHELSLLQGPKLLLHTTDYGEYVECLPQQ